MRSFIEAALSALGDERMTPLERLVTADAELTGALGVLDDAHHCWGKHGYRLVPDPPGGWPMPNPPPYPADDEGKP